MNNIAETVGMNALMEFNGFLPEMLSEETLERHATTVGRAAILSLVEHLMTLKADGLLTESEWIHIDTFLADACWAERPR